MTQPARDEMETIDMNEHQSSMEPNEHEVIRATSHGGCPKCGTASAGRCNGDDIYCCGSDSRSQSASCRIRELESTVARLTADNAETRRERDGLRRVVVKIADQFGYFDLPDGVRLLHVTDEDGKEAWKIIRPNMPRGPMRHGPRYFYNVLDAIRAALTTTEPAEAATPQDS